MAENRSLAFGLTGFSAIVAVIALALRGGSSAAPVSSAPPSASAPAPATRTDSSKREKAIAAFDRGRELIEEYLGISRGDTLPSGRHYEVRVLIATVPDPYDSHLDWSYDSYLESFRRSFAQAGYVPDRFWLPGRDETIKFSDSPAPVRLHDVAPGVFLFRSIGTASPSLWLLYLVPEVPTSGVHQGALAAALAERRSLRSYPDSTLYLPAGHADSLLIAGPIFSGSARSLRFVLDRARAEQQARVVRVVTGSATSYGNRQTLTRDAICPRTADTLRSCISFGSTVHSDEAMSTAFDHVIDDLGYTHDQVAVLSESATQYGADSTSHAGRGYLTISFPLNIASLRSEFDRTSRPLEQSPLLGLGEGPRTRLSLDESAKPRESPPVVSRLTVPTLDVVMDNAMQQLRAHDIRAVVIKATDVRDKLMLARELRRRLRDVVLFTYENNALFLRPEYLQALQGMMVMTTYPLVLDNQYWTSRRGDAENNLMAFPNDAALGIYNATLALIDAKQPMLEYAPPASAGGGIPPVWVSTVGRGTFFPVRTDSAPTAWRDYLVPATGAPRATPASRRLGLAQFIDGRRLFTLGWILSCAVLLALLLLKVRGHRVWFPMPLSSIGLTPPTTPRQRFYVGLLFWSVASTVFPFAVGVEARHMLRSPYPELGHPLTLPTYAAIALTLWSFIVGARLVLSYLADVLESRGKNVPETPDEHLRPSGRLAVGVITTFSVLYFIASTGYVATLAWHVVFGGSESTLLLARVSDFFSGVTPLPLISVFGVAFTIWTWWQLQQTKELEHTQILESAVDALTSNPETAEARMERLRSELLTGRRVLQWFLPDGLTKGMAVVILFATAAFLVRSNPTMERLTSGVIAGRFLVGGTLALGFLGLVTTVSWAIYRLVATWRSLERLLMIVAELPLVHAFGRLPQSVVGNTPIGFIGLAGDTDSSAPDELWQHVDAASKACLDDAALAPAKALGTVLRTDDVELPASAQRLVRTARGMIHGWRAAGSRLNEKGELTETAGTDTRLIAALRAAEEFVALGVFVHVERILLNLRRLALFLLITLLLSVVGLSSYVFQPQGMIKGGFIGLVIAAVVALFFVMTRMSRNDVLSRITRTTPGKVTWDTSFVLNLMVFGAIPLLVLLSSEFPTIRSFLFSWADPVVKAVAKL